MRANNRVTRLTEQDLHYIVEDVVRQYVNEEMDEGFWNQMKSGANTMFQRGGNMGMGQRFKNAVSNYKTQGKLDNLSGLKQQLEQYIDAGQLNPQMTIAQLVGGKYNGNKFGSLTGKMGNMRSQISKKGGTSY